MNLDSVCKVTLGLSILKVTRIAHSYKLKYTNDSTNTVNQHNSLGKDSMRFFNLFVLINTKHFFDACTSPVKKIRFFLPVFYTTLFSICAVIFYKDF